jgi:hypothetical protein
MKHLSLLILAAMIAIPVFGQRGFYVIGTTTSLGSELVNMGRSNSYYCSLKKGDKVIKYTPFEVSEYGYNKGQVYKAFDVVFNGQKERYFFEQIVNGNINLYNLRLKGGISKYYILPADL